jgi:dTDP-4-dehydrorhamnose reductase
VKALVTGAAGQVGIEVTRALEARGHDVTATTRERLDITNRDAVGAAVDTLRPEVIINAAAYTAVDAAEGDPDGAYAGNALGVRHLAEAATRVGAHLVQLSTDYVFDGTKDTAYLEWDPPNPASVYGASKLAGEYEAQAAPSWTVVRTSWVCSAHGSNMVRTILTVAGRQQELAFVDDQRGCPTFADDLSEVVVRLAVDRRPGLYHATNEGAVSWYEFAQAVLTASGDDPNRVRPIATSDLDPPRPAPRPANSVLDNAALRLAGLPTAPPWDAALARAVAALT